MLLAAAASVALPALGAAPRLAFDVTEGPNLNSFLREGPVAAHLLLRSGSDPRILIAFPAGNSGVGLWFSHTALPVHWSLQGRPQPLITQDSRGRPLYGMTAEVIVSGAPDLSVKEAVLSSVRVLRDYQALGTFPAEVGVKATTEGSALTWARDRLDGAAGYRLSIEVTHGSLQAGRFTAAGDGKMALKITALSGEVPLTPLWGKHLLNNRAQADAAARNVLTFLSYKEKFLAGSWRFNTYFGRDTLMSVRLLMPVLAPDAVDAGLGAVRRACHRKARWRTKRTSVNSPSSIIYARPARSPMRRLLITTWSTARSCWHPLPLNGCSMMRAAGPRRRRFSVHGRAARQFPGVRRGSGQQFQVRAARRGKICAGSARAQFDRPETRIRRRRMARQQ